MTLQPASGRRSPGKGSGSGKGGDISEPPTFKCALYEIPIEALLVGVDAIVEELNLMMQEALKSGLEPCVPSRVSVLEHR